MAITEGEWRGFTTLDGRPIVAVIPETKNMQLLRLPQTLGDAKLMAAAPALAQALRQLHDLASVLDAPGYGEESRAAFARAAELLRQLGF